MIQIFKSPDRIFYTVSYILFSVPLVIFLSFYIPAFQVPDESSHFVKAYQLAHGEFFPTKQEVPGKPGEYTVGGTVDSGLMEAARVYRYLIGKPEVKVDRQKTAVVDSLKWRSSDWYDTRNVSVYPPIHYMVSTLGVILGQSLDLTIVDTLKLSRLLNGIIALLVISIAFLGLRKGHGIFFVIMLMPMTVSQIASTSQDATSFAAIALCVTLMSQFRPDLPQSKRRTLLLLSSLLLVSVAIAKPPYIALSLFYLYFAFEFRAQKGAVPEFCIAFFGSLLAVVAWTLYMANYVSVPHGPVGVDYAEQALFIIQSPFGWLGILISSWQERWFYWSTTFIAKLGSLDTAFPYPYYGLAAFTLVFSLAMGFLTEGKTILSGFLKNALGPWVIILITLVGINAVMYILWSPVGNPRVEGIQGRYLIPPALFLALSISDKALSPRTQIVYRCMIIVFAISTLIVTPYAVLNRYY